MHFRKMHGLGNDFVIIDARTESITLNEQDLREIADRRRGVGCDLITILEGSQHADVRAQFFNADGSESGACGNATRCVADIVMSESGLDSCTIAVSDGILSCQRIGDLMVEVDMGAAKDVADLDLAYGAVSNPVSVNMGNPHCVFFVDKLEDIDVEGLGAYFEVHKAFPHRTNVEFVQVIDKGHLRQKTWERGVGVTEACGSGACAVAVAALRRGLSDAKVNVELDGGILHMQVRESDDHVLMAGPVAYVFDGEM